MSNPGRSRGGGGGGGHGAGGSGQTDKIPQWTTWDEFCKWFWNGSNGNNLIKKLNGSSQNTSNDSIRREKFRPTVYCIVLNDGQFPGKSVEMTETERTKEVQWKLCNVGFTHVDTTTGTNNRMEVVKNEVCRKYKDNKRKKAEEKQKKEKKGDGGTPKEEEEVEEEEEEKVDAGVLFVLPIGAVDTTPFSETAERIRKAVGWPVRKDLAKTIGLPCSTEWVLTTQAFIDKIKKEIDEKKKDRTGDLIDLFKNLKFNKTPPTDRLRVTLEDDSDVKTVTDFDADC